MGGALPEGVSAASLVDAATGFPVIANLDRESGEGAGNITIAADSAEYHAKLRSGNRLDDKAEISSASGGNAAVTFKWDEDEWTGGAFKPCEWEDVSLKLTLEGEGVDGHGFTVRPKEISAYFWIPEEGGEGGGRWKLTTLSSAQVEALGDVFTRFREKPDEEEGDGAPGYDPDSGVALIGGTKTYSGSTNESGKLIFQQVCYANDVFVTQRVNLEAEDGTVIK